MTLHEVIEAYCPQIDKLMNKSSGIIYTSMFLEPDVKSITSDGGIELLHQMQKIYTLGIIERAHLSCVTSLARASRWLTAAGQLADSVNILAFSAALRGFLESAADAFDLMEKLPPTIAKSSKYCFAILNNPSAMGNCSVSFEAIESLLIHFTYAGRPPQGVPPLKHHTNKSNAEYIRKIEQFGVLGASNLYSETCELTHPASASVLCFVDQSERSLTFNPGGDHALIADILSRYQETILGLAQYSINPALITLSLLNRLVPALPALPDRAMISVGNTSQLLSAFDTFVIEYNQGIFDPIAILRELS